jgi:hypothetical protein
MRLWGGASLPSLSHHHDRTRRRAERRPRLRAREPTPKRCQSPHCPRPGPSCSVSNFDDHQASSSVVVVVVPVQVRPSREVVGSGARPLHHGRQLNAVRRLEYSREDEPVPLVRFHWVPIRSLQTAGPIPAGVPRPSGFRWIRRRNRSLRACSVLASSRDGSGRRGVTIAPVCIAGNPVRAGLWVRPDATGAQK